MYSIVRASGILKESDGSVRYLELSSIPLNRLYADYLNVEAILTHSTNPAQELQLDLEQLPVGLCALSMTLPQWFSVIGNTTLPTKPVEPVDTMVCARFYNLWQQDFNAEMTNVAFHPEHVLASEELVDVMVTRIGAQYDRLARNGIMTVNGLLHRTDYNEHGLYALGGGITRRKSNRCELGYLDLKPLGNFEILPITPAMIAKSSDTDALKHAVYLNIGKSLVGKTALLVIAGRLHALDDTYKVVGDTLLKFDFANYPFFKRLAQSESLLDLSSLGNLKFGHGPYDSELVYSDVTITKWFTLKQSFIILLDLPELAVGHVQLESPQLTGRYYSNTFEQLPLIVGDRLTEYKVSDEKIGWVINPAVYLEDQLVIEESPYLSHRALAYRKCSNAPVKIPTAKWLRLGKVVESV